MTGVEDDFISLITKYIKLKGSDFIQKESFSNIKNGYNSSNWSNRSSWNPDFKEINTKL